MVLDFYVNPETAMETDSIKGELTEDDKIFNSLFSNVGEGQKKFYSSRDEVRSMLYGHFDRPVLSKYTHPDSKHTVWVCDR